MIINNFLNLNLRQICFVPWSEFYLFLLSEKRDIFRLIILTFIVTGGSYVPDISPELNSHKIFVMSLKDSDLWETEMKSAFNVNIMTGFPFGLGVYWRLLLLFRGRCLMISCVCRGVSLFSHIICCMKKWRHRLVISGFVDKSPTR